MFATQRSFVLALLVAAGSSGELLAAGEGRILGTVTDGAGKPLQGVTVTITSPFNLQKITDVKGLFNVILLDATRNYQIRLEKEGFEPFEGPLHPKVEDTLRETYTLQPNAAPAQPTPPAPQPVPNVSLTDQASYAIGWKLGTDLRDSEARVTEDQIIRGLHDALNNRQSRLSDQGGVSVGSPSQSSSVSTPSGGDSTKSAKIFFASSASSSRTKKPTGPTT